MRLFFSGLLIGFSVFGATNVTFYRDVLPVLQKHCQSCHRAGEIGPMPLLTYEHTRPWARAIREAVRLKSMPPWFADAETGHFRNERRLSPQEIETLTSWADANAPAGDPMEAPPPVRFTSGWSMGKPDYVLRPPSEYVIPPSGVVQYTYVIVPTGFTEDRWVNGIEMRPSDRSTVHHLVAYLRPPGSHYFRDYPAGEFFVPNKKHTSRPPEVHALDWRGWLAEYVPGMPPQQFEPGQAKLIPAGSDIVFELHYTTNGTASQDRPYLGFRFAKEPPEERVESFYAINVGLRIPPRANNHRVDASLVFEKDVKLISLFPHMHLRGKAFEYRLVYPTGEEQTVLRVPKYDFNWQLRYELEKPLHVPKGTKLECTAHFDNSPNNPANPDPDKEVRWGDQSWEEMMIGFFEMAFDRDQDPREIIPRDKPNRTARAGPLSPE